MSKAEDMRNRARRIQARDAPSEDASSPAPPPPAPARVRQTVDLTGQRHRDLAAWRLDTALALGRTRLTTQDVLAAAVELLLTDDSVGRRLRAKLEEVHGDTGVA